MFSTNFQISERQFRCLIVLDWMGKALLLLPQYLKGRESAVFLGGILVCMCLCLLYAAMLGKMANMVEGDYFQYLTDRLGKVGAFLMTVIYECYAILNVVFLTWLFARIASTYLLPEHSSWMLLLLVLVAGMCNSWKGLETRGRTAEIFFGILLYPILALLILAALSLERPYLEHRVTAADLETLSLGGRMFLSFGGMSIFLFVSPYVKGKKFGGMLGRGIIISCLLAFFALLIGVGVYGPSGIKANEWPVISLMSNTVIPGGLLGRWDVLFTALLLVSLMVAVGTSLFYMKFLSNHVTGLRGNGNLIVSGTLVFLLAMGCGSYDNAQNLYVVVGGGVLLPILVAMTVILYLLDCIKRKKEKRQ